MQKRYSVTKIELLAIVEMLRGFTGMLLGQKLIVYTDHQNLVRDALGSTSDRVYRWRLIVEEYGPKIVHIEGINKRDNCRNTSLLLWSLLRCCHVNFFY